MNIDAVISELRSLNEDVPIPPRLPTAKEVAAAEQRLGIAFPPQFRKYLLEASDVVFGTVEPVTITDPTSHTHLDDVARAAWSTGVPRNQLPFCESDGDYYCLTASGEVVSWSHNGIADEHWPDLASWIESVWIEEG